MRREPPSAKDATSPSYRAGKQKPDRRADATLSAALSETHHGGWATGTPACKQRWMKLADQSRTAWNPRLCRVNREVVPSRGDYKASCVPEPPTGRKC